MKILNWDTIIIGTGIAGLFTALNIDKKLNVLMITKSSLDRGNSTLAQGGIVSCINPQIHFEDTLKAGAYCNNKEAIKVLEEDCKENIEKLIDYGVNFDKDNDGNLKFTREGGHRDHTILYSKDTTGKEIIRALSESVKNRINIKILEDTFILDMISEDKSINGVIVLNKNNEVKTYSSKTVIIATGGVGQVYKNTTNSEEITGDGIALGYKAGCNIKDMEFIQFHPTSMYKEDSSRRFLISEAVRGEGAVLKNINKEYFMDKYHEMADLAPRDIVSRSIFSEMIKTNSPFVYLDITHKDGNYIKDRFPNIYSNCLEVGIDMTKNYIPVAPSEHYIMGGIMTDLWGRTNIKGLYACGECTCTGLHGANRLASNSLLEGIVFGGRIAKDINNNYDNIKCNKDVVDEHIQNNYTQNTIINNQNISYIEDTLKDTMDKYVSIIRSEKGLLNALEIVMGLGEMLKREPTLNKKYFEIENMIIVSLLIIKSALNRKESIGSHYII